MALNSVWLKVLKDSKRTSRLARSRAARGKVLNKDRLVLNSPGKTTASLPALPKPSFPPPFHGAFGSANELLVNQMSPRFGYETGATWFGRFVVPPPKPSTSAPE